MRIAVPHGRVYLALAQLAQQAHTRDVQGDDVPIVCPPNILSEPTEAHGRLVDRALLGKPNSTLGGSRRTNAQESTTQKAHAFVGTRAEDRGWSRDDLRKISRAAPEALRSRGRQRKSEKKIPLGGAQKSDQLFGMGNTGARPYRAPPVVYRGGYPLGMQLCVCVLHPYPRK